VYGQDNPSFSPAPQALLIIFPKQSSSDLVLGTGKSVLLREIIKLFRDKPRNSLAITASTGIASLNIGGQTLHSWAGVGLAKLPVDKLKWAIATKKQLSDRWRKVECLIIDESKYGS
jgi:hypothetical protein